ncbi:MAG: GNAT family N-acetyltransferase [Gallionella sp.]|nr:GNAT family N-acetyltransferase [Gallionella sp.]
MSEPVFSVEWVPSESGIDQAIWDICFPPPLEGRWWYRALERCGIEDQFQFMYAVVRMRDRPVAIAPAFVMNVPITLVLPPWLLPPARLLGRIAPSVLYQRTLFAGSPCSDEGTVGMVPGADRLAVLLCVQQALRAQARKLNTSMLVWKDFPATCKNDMEALSRSAGLFRITSFPGTVADLPGPSKEAYFAAMKASRRHLLKKKLRRSAEHVAVDIDVVQQPDAQSMDEIFGLFWQTYEKATTQFERLNRRFFDLIAQEPQSYFIMLREHSTGKLLAFMLCFAFRDHVINKFIGIDYRRPKEWLLYFRLWEAALDWALSRGAGSIQSGQTGYAPKIEIGHKLVPLTNYCAHRNPLVHRIYAAVARTVSWQTLDADLARHIAAHPEDIPDA